MRMHLRLRSWVAAAIVMAVSVIATASERAGIGKTGEIELQRPTHFGATLLPAGHYRVQHQMIEGQHYLVIRHQDLGRDNVLRDTGHDVAQIRCQIVTFDTAHERTELLWTKNTDGTGTATQIRVQGEGGGHIIALEPSGEKRPQP